MAWYSNRTPLSQASYNVSVSVSPALRRLWLRGSDNINKEMERVVSSYTMLIKGKIQVAAPIGVYGILRKSIGEKTSFDNSSDKASGRIFIKQTAPYGVYVEKGTRGQRMMPPYAKLRKWVKRKIPHDGLKDLERKTFLIRRKIKSQGINAQYYMLKPFNAERDNIFRAMVAGINKAKI